MLSQLKVDRLKGYKLMALLFDEVKSLQYILFMLTYISK